MKDNIGALFLLSVARKISSDATAPISWMILGVLMELKVLVLMELRVLVLMELNVLVELIVLLMRVLIVSLKIGF